MFDRALKGSFVAQRTPASRRGPGVRPGAGPGLERTAIVARPGVVARQMPRPGVRPALLSQGTRPSGRLLVCCAAAGSGPGRLGRGTAVSLPKVSLHMLRRASPAGIEAAYWGPAVQNRTAREGLCCAKGRQPGRESGLGPCVHPWRTRVSAMAGAVSMRVHFVARRSTRIAPMRSRNKDTNVHITGQDGGDCGQLIGGSSGLGSSASRCRLCGGCGGRGSLGELHKRPLKRQKR